MHDYCMTGATMGVVWEIVHSTQLDHSVNRDPQVTLNRTTPCKCIYRHQTD